MLQSDVQVSAQEARGEGLEPPLQGINREFLGISRFPVKICLENMCIFNDLLR